MSNFLFLFLFFFSIFSLITYILIKTKNIKLTREDYYHWLRINNRLRFQKIKFINHFVKPIIESFNFFVFNFLEKFLRRIKIEALKIETWATKKIEKIRKEKKKDDLNS